jgi:hypothetical protein
MKEARGERKRRKRLLIVAPSVEHGAFQGAVPHETESADSESGPSLGPHPPPPRLRPAFGGGRVEGEFRHFGDQKYSVLRLIQRIFVKEMRQSRQILEDFISEIAIF